jgi:hypothetical protein|tara:strand:+ start:165 stop:320 length:156 start_codon:yes stop_codon:yes gene_type:complete
MTKKELERILESVTVMGEALTGLRAKLVNGGFSEEMAEEIILQTLKNQEYL